MAEELDPATNLPKEEDPVKETSQSRRVNSDKGGDVGTPKSASDMLRLRRQKPGIGLTRGVQGTHGEYPGITVTSDRNFNEIRAQQQSFGDLTAGAITQSAGKVAGTLLKTVGFAGQMPGAIASFVMDSEIDFEGNAMTRAGDYLEEQSRELSPIYKTEQAKSGEMGRFIDGTYWFSHIPDIVNTAAFLAASYGGAFAGGSLARMMRLGKKAQKIGATLGGATFGRHTEGMLEGTDTFEQIMKRAREAGIPEQEAKRVAGEKAAEAYRMGYSNMLTDFIGTGALLRGVKLPSRNIRKSIAELGEESGDELMQSMSRILKQNPTATMKEVAQKAGASYKDFLLQSGLEGAEEYNQEFIKNLSTYNADVALGLGGDDEDQMNYVEGVTSGVFGETFRDPKAWDAALMGFLGGAGMQAVHGGLTGEGGIQNLWNKNIEERNERLKKAHRDRAEYIKKTMRDINFALQEEDMMKAQKKREDMIFNLAIGGLTRGGTEREGFNGSVLDGNMDNVKEMFQAIQNMPAEELERFDLNEDAKSEAQWAIEELDNIRDKVNGYYNKINNTGVDEELSVLLAEHSYRNEKNKDHISNLRSEIEKGFQTDTPLSERFDGIKPEQERFVRLKGELEAKKKTYRKLKEAAEQPNFNIPEYRANVLDKVRRKSLARLQKEIKDTAQELSNLIPKKQRKKVLSGNEYKMDGIDAIEDVGQDADIPLTDAEVNESLEIAGDLVSEGTDLRSLYDNLEETRAELFEGQRQIPELQKDEVIPQIAEAIETTGEDLRKGTQQKIFKKSLGDNRYIKKGEKLYRVTHDEQTPEEQMKYPETGEGIQVGKEGQWTSQGVDQFEEPRVITDVQEQDGEQFVQFEGESTYVPESEVSLSEETEQEATEETEPPSIDITEDIETNLKKPKRISPEPVTLQEVGTDLEPVEGSEPFEVEDVTEYMDAIVVEPDRILSQEEFELSSEEIAEHIENKNYDEAFSILENRLRKSNFEGQRVDELKNSMRESIIDQVSDINSPQELIAFFNKLQDTAPDYMLGDYDVDGERQAGINRHLEERSMEISKRYSDQIKALNKAITKRENDVDQAISEFESIENEIATLEQELDQFTEDILTELQEQGVQKLDRRTKPAKRIEKMEEQVDAQIQDLRARQEALENQAKEAEQDLKFLNRLKKRIGQKELPSTITSKELSDTKDLMETLRNDLMLRSNFNAERLEQLQDNYKDLQSDLKTAIQAIENFHNRLKDLNGASEVLRKASSQAYQDLLEEGLLDGTESIFAEVPAQVFNRYRTLFNKHLTEEIRDFDELSPELRKIINENRLTEEVQGGNVDYWARMNKDFPTESELFRSEDMENIRTAIEKLGLLREAHRDVKIYNRLLQMYAAETNRRLAAEEPEVNKPADETDKVKDRNAIKRILEGSLNRMAGDSGSNADPNPQASQRRYFRYVNKTNFEESPHYMEMIHPTEEMVSDERLEELDTTREETIFGVLVDENGNYIDEQGNTSSNFDASTHLYTPANIPSFETLENNTSKIVDNAEYLKNRYPKVKSEEKRQKLFERDKKEMVQRYEELWDEWMADIEEQGYSRIGITGKSLGLEARKENWKQYEQGVEPNSLKEVFDNTDQLEFTVIDKGYMEHQGDFINVPNGYVEITNPDTGNIIEGARRRLNKEEVDTIIELLRHHVKDSEIKSPTFIDTREANAVPGSEVNVNDAIRDLTYAFTEGKKSRFEFVSNSKVPGGEIRINHFDGSVKTYHLFANNPQGKGKINNLNPDLVTGLRKYLSKAFNDPDSAKVANNEPYSKIVYKDGEFTTRDYDSYYQYMIEEDVIGTWIQENQEIKLEDGTTEEGYKFLNQNLTYSLPEVETKSNSEKEINDAEVPSSLAELGLGKHYLTPIDESLDFVYEVIIPEKGDIEINLVNKKHYSDAELEQAKEGILKFKKLLKNQRFRKVYPEGEPDGEGSRDRNIVYPTPKDLPTGWGEWILRPLKTQHDFIYRVKKTEDGTEIDLLNAEDYSDEQQKRAKEILMDESYPLKEILTKEQDAWDQVDHTKGTKQDGAPSNEDIDSRISELSQMFGDDNTSDTSLGEDDITAGPSEQRISHNKRVSRAKFNRVKEKLSEATGLPVDILTRGQAINLMENLRFQGYQVKDYAKSPEDLPYGMHHKGHAYVFGKDNLSLETLFHEISHPVIDRIIETNPYLFEQLQDELRSSQEGRKIIDHVIKEYDHLYNHERKHLSQAGWAEAIVTMMGRTAENKQLRKDANVDSFITRIFKAIKDFFKKVFGSKIDVRDLSLDTTISDLADILVEGDPLHIPEPTGEFEYSKADKNRTILPHGNLVLGGENSNKSVKFTQDAMRMVNQLFFDKMLNEYSERLPSLFDRETPNADLQDQLYQDVKDDIRGRAQLLISKLSEFKKEGVNTLAIKGNQFTYNEVNDIIDNLRYIYSNFEEVRQHHRRHLVQYNIEPVREETFEDQIEKDSNRLWQQDHIKFSAKQNATSKIRFLVGSLTSNRINESFPTVQQNVDFGETYNVLANHLSNTTTLSEKESILEKYSHLDGFKELKNRLFGEEGINIDEMSINDAHQLLQFNEAFSKHDNTYKLIISDDSSTFKAVDATVNSTKNRVLSQWKSNAYNNSEVYSIEDGEFRYDQQYFKEKYPDNFVLIRDNELTQQQKNIVENQKPNKQGAYRKHFRVLNFLNDLGIVFNEEARTIPAGEDFNERAQYILSQIKEGDSPDIFSPDSNTYQNLNKIAEHEVRNSVERIETQHQNIEGETVYNVVLNHYVSLVEDKINKVSSLEELFEELPHLRDSYTQNSLLLNRNGKNGRIFNLLFDSDFSRATDRYGTQKDLTIDITEGMKNNRESESFNQLAFPDKVKMEINSFISDRFNMFRAGDKKLERFMELQFFTGDAISNGAHLPTFKNYLADELNFLIDKKDSNIKGLDRLYTDKGNINYEFTILPRMLSGNKELKSLMDDIFEGEKDIKDIYSGEYQETIRSQMNQYFEKKTEDLKDFLQEMMLIQKDGERYLNNGIRGLIDDSKKSDTEQSYYTEAQLDKILKKAIINRSIANVEQTKLFTGHPAFYSKNDLEKSLDNFFHRMSGAFGTKKSSSVGHMENQIIEEFFPSDHRLYKKDGKTYKNYQEGAKPIIRTAVFADPEVKSTYLSDIKKELNNDQLVDDVYGEMEEADAMGLVSLDTYRDMKIRNAEWNEDLERLYQWEMRPEGAEEVTFENWDTGEVQTITRADLRNSSDNSRTVFTMLKPQYFGPMAEQGFIPGMYKLAVMPILPSYNTEAFNRAKNYMNNNDVGLITFESANKVGVVDPGQQVYDESGYPNFENVTTQDTWFDYWGLQLQTGNKIKDEVTLGSQFMKQIISGIYSQGSAKLGSSQRLGDLANQMGDIHNALIKEGMEELRQELELEQLPDGNYTTESVEDLIDFLYEEAVKRDANHNVLDSLQNLGNYINKGSGLDVLSNRDKVENILASIADSRVITQKTHGGAKVQAASTFFEEQSRNQSGGTLRSNELAFYPENGEMEVLLPHYFKEELGDLQLEDGQIADEDIDIDPELLQAIGFRIPTSGLNVIENIKIKGFLPQSAGETIVLPTEIVAKAGSDFDVDKLNLMLPNYAKVDNEYAYIQYIDSKAKAEKVMEDVRDRMASREGKTPTKKGIIRGLRDYGYDRLADVLEEGDSFPTDPRQLNTREGLQNGLIETSREIITDQNNRKSLLNPIGINILEDIKDDVNEKRNISKEKKGFNDMLFDVVHNMRITQRNIESIAGTGLAALHVSDHVHATRYNYHMQEDFEIALPHNSTEDGEISLAHKLDADGNDIGNLLNQITNMFIDGVKNPISFDLNLNLDTAGTALYLARAGVPADTLFSFLNQPAVRDYIRLESIRKSQANQGNEILSKRDVRKRLEKKYGKKESSTELTKEVLDKQLDASKSTKMIQRKVLNEFQQYESDAKNLTEYVNATRIDTVAMGKNTAQLDLMLHSLNKINDGSVTIKNSYKVLQREENGFLAPHYEALKSFREIFTPYFAHLNNNDAQNMFNGLVEHVDGKEIQMEEKVRILDRFKSDFITHKVLNNDVTINGEPVSNMGSETDLFVGEQSLPKRIQTAQQNDHPNLLVQQLLPIIGRNEIHGQLFDNLKLVNQKMDTIEQNELIEAWRELFHTDPALAHDLTMFTFIQNGLQLSPMTFTDYIPSEIYSEVINSAFQGGNEVNQIEFLEKFFENNYNDENLVPTAWGEFIPDGPIYKRYEYKDQYKVERDNGSTNWEETKKNAKQARKQGKNPYKSVPNIRIKKPLEIGGMKLFENTDRLQISSIKDFRNNRSFYSYGIPSVKETIDTEHYNLTEQQVESINRSLNKSPDSEIETIMRCLR